MASRSELEARDPSLLVRAEWPVLRRLGVRFFLSSGPSHGAVLQSGTEDFAHELAGLRLPYRLWLLPPGTKGIWRAQFEPGLVYALKGGRLG